MTRKPSNEIASEAYLESLAALLANGYNDEVKAFTKGMETSQDAVLGFQIAFDMLNEECVIKWKGTPLQEASMARVGASLEEMRTFLEGIGRPFETYVVVTNHGHDATFEIGWQDQKVGPVVWDRWTDGIDDPVMAFADIGFLFDIKKYQYSPKIMVKPEPPLYRYHPERFKAYRDYAEPVGKIYRQKVEPTSGMITVDQFNEVMSIIVPEMNRLSMAFPRKLKEFLPHPSLVVEAEETLATAYGRFVQAGRQIMDFPPALTEMLEKTDIGDIPLNNIKLPYASQYLHFGPKKELEIEPGWLVDGAYVEW